MKTNELKPKVFLSYTHSNNDEKDFVLKFIKKTIENQGFELWHDGDILTGENINNTINRALEECSVFICLISQDYLFSDYCMDNELRLALDNNLIDKTSVFPIILSYCTWQQYSFSELLCQPKDAQPLDSFENQDKCMVEVTEELIKVLENVKKKLTQNPNY